jgi:hypothetical protein
LKQKPLCRLLFDQDCNRYRSSASAAENLPSFPSGEFSARSLIAPQIEYINPFELLFQRFSESILRIVVQKTPV